jgi:PhzF family phenazine biosynthesis protein
MDLPFRLLNVFALPGDPLSGNPLCVFEDGRGLPAERMQALARQVNLSETTFVLPPEAGGTARVRIFTPSVEMPFAGHPTLGTAAVVRALSRGAPPRGGEGAGDRVVLELPAGAVEVRAEGARFTLAAPRAPATRRPALTAEALAAMVGLAPGSFVQALFVDTGVEQLLLQVKDAAAVRAAAADPARLARDAGAAGGSPTVYVFAEVGPEEILARCFFAEHGAAVEDPATGSACANLGGWLLAAGAPLPARRTVAQGAQIGRPSRLGVEVDAGRVIHVSGEVVEVGRGVFTI